MTDLPLRLPPLSLILEPYKSLLGPYIKTSIKEVRAVVSVSLLGIYGDGLVCDLGVRRDDL